MKNWDDYRFVLSLHRFGTITDAAEALGVTKVTVSRRIERVSNEIGMRLFEFRENRWVVTDVGETIARIAARIEEENSAGQSVISSSSDEITGTVVINTISYLNEDFLAENVHLLKALHPRLTPVLDAAERRISLARGEADIAIRLAEPFDGRLVRLPVAKVPVGLFKFAEAESDEWIGLPMRLDWTPEMQLAMDLFGKPPAIRAESFPAVANAARMTGFNALLPTCHARRYKGLIPFRPDKIAARTAWCIYHEKNQGQQRIVATVDWIKKVFGSPRTCTCGKCSS